MGDFRKIEISEWRDDVRVYVPVAEAGEKALKWWAEKGQDQEKRAAAQLELQAHNKGSVRVVTPAAPARSQSIATVSHEQVAQWCGVLESAGAAIERFAKLTEIGHLITPSPVVARIPEGCALTVSAVIVDIASETYPQKSGPGLCLHKPALERIANAASINWEQAHSRRLDSAVDPWYCRMQMAGKVRNYDLSWRPFFDYKELDLRDGAPIPEGIIAREKKVKAEQRDKYKGDFGASEIAEKRRHIQSLCLSEARLRAIRSGLALRQAYTREQLEKPFFVVAIAFTGHSSDPETRREFSRMIGRSFLGDSALLFGPAAVSRLPPIEDSIGHAPPPVGSALDQDDDGLELGADDDGPPREFTRNGVPF